MDYNVDTLKNIVTAGTLNYTPKDKVVGDYLLRGQLGILFADSGAGKTTAGVDIAMAITGNGPSWWPGLETITDEPVAYVNLELDHSQITKRLLGQDSNISPKLVWITPEEYKPGEEAFHKLTLTIKELQADPDPPKIIIIDPMAALFETMTVKNIATVMSTFKRFKDDYGLTILVIQHTHKTKPGKPLTKECIYGSKMQDILADTIIGLGNSVLGDEYVYLKHLKQRDGVPVPGVATLVKNDDPYVHLEFVEMSEESEHLSNEDTTSSRSVITPDMEPIIISLRAKGVSIRDIAAKLGLKHHASVGRYCKKNGI